jgi:hypothetical protein
MGESFFAGPRGASFSVSCSSRTPAEGSVSSVGFSSSGLLISVTGSRFRFGPSNRHAAKLCAAVSPGVQVVPRREGPQRGVSAIEKMGHRQNHGGVPMERSSASVGSGLFRCRSGFADMGLNPQRVPIHQEVAAKSSLARFPRSAERKSRAKCSMTAASMGSATIQARFGETTYPVRRFIFRSLAHCLERGRPR